MTNTQRARLVAWINSHDTGVSPAAIDCGAEAGIQVYGEAVHVESSRVSVTVDVVHTYEQARAVLGY